jgi:arginine-tRNA-protein transferase
MNIYHRTESPASLPPEVFDLYLGMGWYRMRQYLFTCSHLFDFNDTMELSGLRRVWWMRFAVQYIQNESAHRKLRKKNGHFMYQFNVLDHLTEDDRYLYRIYRNHIDFDTYDDLEDALWGSSSRAVIFQSWILRIYDGEKLIALGIFDKGQNAASSQIHCYDPAYARHSLGKYLMLLTIDHLKRADFQWYYPGYVFAGYSKMNYKLFLGKEYSEYFDPEGNQWLGFDESILDPETYSEETIREIGKALFRS